MTGVKNYRDLTAEEQSILWEKCKAGDENGRRELLELNYPLVRAIVSRFAYDPQKTEDLFQGGVLGLLFAMERFDPKRGVPFGTYAFPFIKGEVLKCLSEMKGEKKGIHLKAEKDLPLKQALSLVSVSLEEWLEEGDHAAFADLRAEEMFLAAEDKIVLEEAVSRLNEEEKRLLYYRYHLKKSQCETGKELSLSQTRISRKEKEILEKLRGSM